MTNGDDMHHVGLSIEPVDRPPVTVPQSIDILPALQWLDVGVMSERIGGDEFQAQHHDCGDLGLQCLEHPGGWLFELEAHGHNLPLAMAAASPYLWQP